RTGGVLYNVYLLGPSPPVHALAAVGLGILVRLIARGDAALQRSLFRATAGVAVLMGLLATTRFALTCEAMAGDVSRRDVGAADWIVRNLPRGVAMANLATSVEYL